MNNITAMCSLNSFYETVQALASEFKIRSENNTQVNQPNGDPVSIAGLGHKMIIPLLKERPFTNIILASLPDHIKDIILKHQPQSPS